MEKSKVIGNKSIKELVDENYIYASVLYYFGIQFYDYSTETLEQVCAQKGLQLPQVIKGLESVSRNSPDKHLLIFAYPVDLIIEYLKHKHFLFIKQELPYILKLVSEIPDGLDKEYPVVADLKFVFPHFVEDFIHHIFEEEDTLFSYILALHKSLEKKVCPPDLYFKMEQNSIQRFAMEHDEHDDEMRGIRKITHNYATEGVENLLLKVVYKELRQFEESLKLHAKIENEILFPRALMLEREVKEMYQQTSKFN
ncbi:hemerythrin domain-containing protein [Cytophagales bacterium LB-30]|uniref:Hemerythrin domain-containing protein n=1 Tax=Shiella aurantiaca TaxID=3058365 RepID=A0ABT8F6Z6_9BACT|nr:hemerythrin domain-containing protein [Shiella aurantiaca]MDN4166202.1 hemerythrin domain-containing protein [Shiella aurantiaca]